jgi:hypothetical protein
MQGKRISKHLIFKFFRGSPRTTRRTHRGPRPPPPFKVSGSDPAKGWLLHTQKGGGVRRSVVCVRGIGDYPYLPIYRIELNAACLILCFPTKRNGLVKWRTVVMPTHIIFIWTAMRTWMKCIIILRVNGVGIRSNTWCREDQIWIFPIEWRPFLLSGKVI